MIYIHILWPNIIADKETVQTEKKMLQEQLETKQTELKAHEARVAKLLCMIL